MTTEQRREFPLANPKKWSGDQWPDSPVQCAGIESIERGDSERSFLAAEGGGWPGRERHRSENKS